jgi:cob(I)alamin adenosyltransferase
MDDLLEEMRSFVLPGGNTVVSYSHIARCVCRRAERIAVHLSEESEVDEKIITYLNRLSDYLFTLSRKLTKDLDANEIAWVPKK